MDNRSEGCREVNDRLKVGFQEIDRRNGTSVSIQGSPVCARFSTTRSSRPHRDVLTSGEIRLSTRSASTCRLGRLMQLNVKTAFLYGVSMRRFTWRFVRGSMANIE